VSIEQTQAQCIDMLLGKPARGAIEIGCGAGEQTAHLVSMGWQIVGVDDIPPNEVKNGFPFLQLDVLDTPPPPVAEYTTVICTELLDREQFEATDRDKLVAYAAGSARDVIVWRGAPTWLDLFKKRGWEEDLHRTQRLRHLLAAALFTADASRFFVLKRAQPLQTAQLSPPSPVVRLDVAPTILVVDDFLTNPDEARKLALGQTYTKQGSAGVRSNARFHNMIDRKVFETLIGKRITDWEEQPINGRFQYCTSEDPIVYHADSQSHAAIVLLTPDAPIEAGTKFLRSRVTGARRSPPDQATSDATFGGNLLDPTKWDVVDVVGNVYNRMAIWDARMIHAASCYFGTKPDNARLFWMFFFNAE
jgi:hypothetical protein